MVKIDVSELTKKQKKKINVPKTISFDEEVVPKHIAQQLLINHGLQEEKVPENDFYRAAQNGQPKKGSTKKSKKQKKNHEMTEDDAKPKKKRKKQAEIEESINVEAEEGTNPKKKKKRTQQDEPSGNNEASSESSVLAPKKKLSIRAQKRLKHEKLKEEKHIQTELSLQQKSLNYLSKWKHSRSEWKFEKLRQIWLQHNMLDEEKISQEFWATLMEYLGNSKGKAKEAVLKSALKVVEDESADQDSVKVLRARDIIQNLSE